ncbi:MFS transporter, partial [Salmonella enterica subsp. enterica serovar Hartford]
LFWGFALGLGALGAGVVGFFADHPIIFLVKKSCVFLPFAGLLTIFFPNNRHKACFYGV